MRPQFLLCELNSSVWLVILWTKNHDEFKGAELRLSPRVNAAEELRRRIMTTDRVVFNDILWQLWMFDLQLSKNNRKNSLKNTMKSVWFRHMNRFCWNLVTPIHAVKSISYDKLRIMSPIWRHPIIFYGFSSQFRIKIRLGLLRYFYLLWWCKYLFTVDIRSEPKN